MNEWRAEETFVVSFVTGEKGYEWCVVSDEGLVLMAAQETPLDEPRARLIAAAPELLMALELLTHPPLMFQENAPPVPIHAEADYEMARVAIAKAKGES